MKKVLAILLVLTCVFGLVACQKKEGNETQQTEKPVEGVVPISMLKIPAVVGVSTYDVGSVTFSMVAGVCEGIMKTCGITTRQIVASTDKARFAPVRAGSIDIVAATSNTATLIIPGRAPFNTSDWGPQQIRILYSTKSKSGTGLYVLENSDIKDFPDVKGHRVTYIPGNDSANLVVECMLAYAGLTWDDVEKCNCSSVADGYKAFAEGRADLCFAGVNSAALQEVSQVHKIRMIESRADNVEGWKRVQAINPGMSYHEYSNCIGYPGVPKGTFGMCGPCYVTYDNCPYDLAYGFAQAMVLSIDEFTAYSEELSNHAVEKAVQVETMIAPYHEGALQYLKDAGYWTDELQERQDELLAYEAKYAKAWNDCLDSFAKSGKKAEEFTAYWDAIRDAVK